MDPLLNDDLAQAAALEVGFQWYAYSQTVTGDERQRALGAHAATYKYKDRLPLGDDDDAKDELIRLRREWIEEAQRIKALRR